MIRNLVSAVGLAATAIASNGQAGAQQVTPQAQAGVLTCDVSAGIGLIITSHKQISCAFAPKGSGRREDYDGYIRKYGLDLGLTSGGFMVWAVFTETVAGAGFLAGDYYGASGEVTLAAGLGANVLVGGSNRTVALQPISISGQKGLNLALGVAALHLGPPRQ
jgi:uncharacterized protein DUF992